MNKTLIDLITPYNSISIIGMSKNAGKTTALNKILAECRERDIKIGLTSIGRDGEDIDIVTGTGKPKIYVAKGTLIATATDLLKKSDITKEIVRTTDINTPMGEVVIVRARSDGYVQIGGSSIGSQIVGLINAFKELGADKILVDGAINRKTFSSPIISDAAILSAGASLSADMNRVVGETAFLAKLLTLRALEDERARALIETFTEHVEKFSAIMQDYNVRSVDLSNPADATDGAKYIYVSGALSDNIMNKLVMSNVNLRGVQIIVDDGSKIFISEQTFEKVGLKGAEIVVKRGINLLAITINPVSASGYAFDKEAFKDALAAQTDIPIYNVYDEKEATG